MSREQQIQLPDGPVPVSADEVEDVEYDDQLSEQRAAELVADVQASPEYRRARQASRRRRGRPSLSGSAGSSARVDVRMPKTQRAALSAYARAHGLKEAEVVREAVDEYLSRHAS